MIMKKSYVLELTKRTFNFAVYSCGTISGMYLPKIVLPDPVPKEIKVTIEVNIE